LEGEPRIRRLFLDWNLFHVEPSYGPLLRAFRRVQAQRAAWLRSGGGVRAVWDGAYVDLAEKVSDRRSEVIRRLGDHSTAVLRDLPQLPPFRLRFYRGWPDAKPLAEALSSSLLADRQRGFSFYGPSRADFRIEFVDRAGMPSRGQAKLVVCVLQIAAQRMWDEAGGPRCIWLLDDLTSEIDRDGAKSVAPLFLGGGRQVFATSVQGDSVGADAVGARAGALFHVEHGALSKLSGPRSRRAPANLDAADTI
jgi:DNA replication and repair protein RecF